MPATILSTLPWPGASEQPAPGQLLTREWLVTNGLGGYASGSIAGPCTRRYHGLLVAALPAPLGRLLMLSHLAEELALPTGRRVRLSGEETPGDDQAALPEILREFRLEMGLPVWRHELDGLVLEKRIHLAHQRNTVFVNYRLLQGESVRLRVRPRLQMRPHEGDVSAPLGQGFHVMSRDSGYEIRSPDTAMPPLRLLLDGDGDGDGGAMVPDGGTSRFFYRIEAARGYPDTGDVWSPGHFTIDLKAGEECTLVATTEAWETLGASTPRQALAAELERRERLLAQAPASARSGMAAQLVLAADQFIVTPSSRLADAVRAQAEGDEARTVIAGYPWFTDWGRDTMISLEGLTLATGRYAEAGWILRTFLHHVKDGLIPNLFPEGENEGLYHTADATLWMFHALDRYVSVTGDTAPLQYALPTLRSIIEHHLRGTRFGIGVDPADGLLRQGAEGYQLTWMDAKVDGWVVTPRRGKAVELNALFYNALRLMQRWLQDSGDTAAAAAMSAHAQRLGESFNRRFWNPRTGCLFDVVDGEHGDDEAIRPNQLLAISLPHAVLDATHWPAVMDVARRLLLTPVGLRSLAPGHADYKPYYNGDLRARDAAYHQGTVWGWLAGPFVDAWLKVHPHELGPVHELLRGFERHLQEAAIGSISEIFDAQAPYTPRGCVAQAWSVAEVLRVAVKVGLKSPAPD